MGHRIPSREPIVDLLSPAFTLPSFRSGCHALLTWIMCLGKRTLQRVGVLILTRLCSWDAVPLLVDASRAHKRGKTVWGLGWFRDAVASPQKRVATASGPN